MHPIILSSDLDKSRLPTSEVACTTCPLATWFSTSTEMRAHCGRMFHIVWSQKQEAIQECSAREDALRELELQRQEQDLALPATGLKEGGQKFL